MVWNLPLQEQDQWEIAFKLLSTIHSDSANNGECYSSKIQDLSSKCAWFGNWTNYRLSLSLCGFHHYLQNSLKIKFTTTSFQTLTNLPHSCQQPLHNVYSSNQLSGRIALNTANMTQFWSSLLPGDEFLLLFSHNSRLTSSPTPRDILAPVELLSEYTRLTAGSLPCLKFMLITHMIIKFLCNH